MAEEATQTSTATETPAVESDPTPPAPTPTEPAEPAVPIAPINTLKHWSRSEGLKLDDDTIGWLENKGFENPQAAITSQRELEKKMGGSPEMLQKWPESDDKEGFEAVYRRLGKPEDVEGYKFEFEEGAAIDPDTLTWFKKTALGRHMPNDMAQGVILDWNTEVARLQAEQQQAIEVQEQIEETELRNAWGTKYDEKIDSGRRALLALGVEEEKVDSLQSVLGPKVLATMAAKIADTMGEDTIASETGTPAFGASEEAVQNQIDELMSDIMADPKRKERYFADYGVPKEATDKDFRRAHQLWAQQRELIKARKGGT